jgi:hypothetical protein
MDIVPEAFGCSILVQELLGVDWYRDPSSFR